MKNNKGQALVEFVIILPIFLLIIMGAIDIGNIIIKDSDLKSNLDDVVLMYNNHEISKIEKYISENDLNINYDENNNYITITVSKDVHVITPGINKIIGDPYKLKESRIVYKNE